MTDIRSQILKEVEQYLAEDGEPATGAVMVMADAMEKCPTLKGLVEGEISTDSDGLIWRRFSDEVQRAIKEHKADR